MKELDFNKEKANREYLIADCKYYKGEGSVVPDDQNKRMFWEYERAWVNMMVNEDNSITEYLAEYIADGIKVDLRGVPVTLIALLYNRYCHFAFNGDGFKDFIETNY